MKIHLIRHAEAISGMDGIEEQHRYLTPRGRTRFRRVARAMNKEGFDIDVILTSPLLRAVQTAEILSETYRFNGDLLVIPRLSPGFSVGHLPDILAAYPYASEIALVGHEPDLGDIVATLLNMSGQCSLKKGAVVSFRLDQAGLPDKAKFLHMITGGGKAISTAESAIDRLVGTKRRLKGER